MRCTQHMDHTLYRGRGGPALKATEPDPLDWLTQAPDPVKAQALIDRACGEAVRLIERAIKVRRARDTIERMEQEVARSAVVVSWNRRAYEDALTDHVRDRELPLELRERAASLLVRL